MDDVRRAAYASWIWAGLQLFLGAAMFAALPIPVVYVAPLFVLACLLGIAGLLTYQRKIAGPYLAIAVYVLMALMGVATAIQGKITGVFFAVAISAVLANFSFKALKQIRAQK